jgi:hypothetical protein
MGDPLSFVHTNQPEVVDVSFMHVDSPEGSQTLTFRPAQRTILNVNMCVVNRLSQ